MDDPVTKALIGADGAAGLLWKIHEIEQSLEAGAANDTALLHDRLNNIVRDLGELHNAGEASTAIVSKDLVKWVDEGKAPSEYMTAVLGQVLTQQEITEVRVNNIQGLAEAVTRNLLLVAEGGAAGAPKQEPPQTQ